MRNRTTEDWGGLWMWDSTVKDKHATLYFLSLRVGSLAQMHPALPCTHFDFDTRRWGLGPEVLEGKPGLATRTPIAVQAPWQGREARSNVSLWRITEICHQGDWTKKEALKSSCFVTMKCTALRIWCPSQPTQKWVRWQECTHMYVYIYSNALNNSIVM